MVHMCPCPNGSNACSQLSQNTHTPGPLLKLKLYSEAKDARKRKVCFLMASLFSEPGADNHVARLEDTLNALRKVLEQLSASNKPAEVDSRRHFYNMFNREADEYDRDFHKKYHDDLNTTLIFVSRVKSSQTSRLTRKL